MASHHFCKHQSNNRELAMALISSKHSIATLRKSNIDKEREIQVQHSEIVALKMKLIKQENEIKMMHSSMIELCQKNTKNFTDFLIRIGSNKGDQSQVKKQCNQPNEMPNTAQPKSNQNFEANIQFKSKPKPAENPKIVIKPKPSSQSSSLNAVNEVAEPRIAKNNSNTSADMSKNIKMNITMGTSGASTSKQQAIVNGTTKNVQSNPVATATILEKSQPVRLNVFKAIYKDDPVPSTSKLTNEHNAATNDAPQNLTLNRSRIELPVSSIIPNRSPVGRKVEYDEEANTSLRLLKERRSTVKLSPVADENLNRKNVPETYKAAENRSATERALIANSIVNKRSSMLVSQGSNNRAMEKREQKSSSMISVIKSPHSETLVRSSTNNKVSERKVIEFRSNKENQPETSGIIPQKRQSRSRTKSTPDRFASGSIDNGPQYASGRPKRSVTPINFAEPKLNTKMRRLI